MLMISYPNLKSYADFLECIRHIEGTTDKKRFLEVSFKECPTIKEVLFYTYNPFMQYYIGEQGIAEIKRKIQATQPAEETTCVDWIQNWQALKSVLDRLQARTLSGNAAITELVRCLATVGKEWVESFLTVLARDIRAGVGVKTINSTKEGAFIPTYETQLANTYDPEKASKFLDIPYWWASPKADGLRGRWDTLTGKPMFLTREGHPITGFSHIEEQCAQVAKLHDICLIDGELYSDRIPFQELAGIILAETKTPEQMKLLHTVNFNIFAMIPNGTQILPKGGVVFTGDGAGVVFSTQDMVEMIYDVLVNEEQYFIYPNLHLLPYQEVDSTPEAMIAAAKEYTKWRWEGAMFRHPENAYDLRRSDNLLKFKFFREADFRIIGAFQGKGKYKGSLGGLICEGEIEEQFPGQNKSTVVSVHFEVGSGFSDTQRAALWELEQQGKLINTIVEVKFQNLTDSPDPATNKYSLRFPTFLKIKADRR